MLDIDRYCLKEARAGYLVQLLVKTKVKLKINIIRLKIFPHLVF